MPPYIWMPHVCLNAPMFWHPCMFGCPHMFGHPLYVWMHHMFGHHPYVCMPLYVWTPPIYLDDPICLDAPLYVWMPPYVYHCWQCFSVFCNVWMPPVCFDAPICLDTTHMFGYPQYVWTPLYVWIMFGCPLHIHNTKKSCFVTLRECPYAPIHLDAPCCLLLIHAMYSGGLCALWVLLAVCSSSIYIYLYLYKIGKVWICKFSYWHVSYLPGVVGLCKSWLD